MAAGIWIRAGPNHRNASSYRRSLRHDWEFATATGGVFVDSITIAVLHVLVQHIALEVVVLNLARAHVRPIREDAVIDLFPVKHLLENGIRGKCHQRIATPRFFNDSNGYASGLHIVELYRLVILVLLHHYQALDCERPQLRQGLIVSDSDDTGDFRRADSLEASFPALYDQGQRI